MAFPIKILLNRGSFPFSRLSPSSLSLSSHSSCDVHLIESFFGRGPRGEHATKHGDFQQITERLAEPLATSWQCCENNFYHESIMCMCIISMM